MFNPGNRNEFLVIAVIMISFLASGVETDVYVPSLPSMLTYFNTTEEKLQWLLSFNFLGLCFSGLIYGPLSDSLGRKKVLLFGLTIFFFSSLACIPCTNIDTFILLRLLQGIGSGASMVVPAAIIYDIFSEEKAAKLNGVFASIATATMAVAPIIGSFLDINFGWRANFVFIAAFAALALFMLIFCYEESVPQEARKPFSLHKLAKDYGSSLLNFNFMAKCILWGLPYIIEMVFIGNMSLIYINHLGVNEKLYGIYQSFIPLSFMVGSMISIRITNKYGFATLEKLGNPIIALSVISLMFVVYFANSAELITTTMVAYNIGAAFSMIFYFNAVMISFPENKGLSASLMSGFRLLATASVIAFSGHVFDGTMLPIAHMSATALVLGAILLIRIKYKEKKPLNI